jgi:diguanylate cyclase (GGDEF)-like protein
VEESLISLTDTQFNKLITLNGVILRAVSSGVIFNLAPSSLAELLNNLNFSAFLRVEPGHSTELYAYTVGKNMTSVRLDWLRGELSHLLKSHLDGTRLSFVPQTLPVQVAVPSALKPEIGVKWLYCMPVIASNRQYGLLLGGSLAPLEEIELRLFGALGSTIAIGLELTTRMESLQYDAAETAYLNQIAAEITDSLDLQELLQYMLTKLENIISISHAALFLLMDRFYYTLAYTSSNSENKPRRRSRQEYKIEGSLIEIVIRERTALINPEQPGELPYIPRGSSLLLLPLIHRNKLHGVLALSYREPNTYRPDTVPLLLIEKMAALFTPAMLNCRLYEEKKRMADFDERVGTYNHNYFERELPMQLDKAHRLNYSLGLLIIDLDMLKTINSQYNYLIGSTALKHIAEIITRNVRRTDIVSRYGGDEFAVLLPGTSYKGLELVSEKIRKAIYDTPIILANNDKLYVTVSLGAAYFPQDAANHRELFEVANIALLESKKVRNEARIGRAATLVEALADNGG